MATKGSSTWQGDSDNPATTSNVSSKRMREDADVIKTTLADQYFQMKKYPDPLAPRDENSPRYWPQGVTKEMEQKWLANIRGAASE